MIIIFEIVPAKYRTSLSFLGTWKILQEEQKIKDAVCGIISELNPHQMEMFLVRKYWNGKNHNLSYTHMNKITNKRKYKGRLNTDTEIYLPI